MFENNDFDFSSSPFTTSNTKKTNIEEKLLNGFSLKLIKLLLTLPFYSRKLILRKILTSFSLFTLLNNAIERQFISERSCFRKKSFKINRTKAITRKISILFLARDKRKYKRHDILII